MIFEPSPGAVNPEARNQSTIPPGVAAFRAALAQLRLGHPRGAGERLTAWLLPPVCVLCGAPGQHAQFDLCPDCIGFLPLRPCGAGRLLAALDYAFPVDALIHELKFGGELRHARLLGYLLAAQVTRRGLPRPTALVPIPLHTSRWRERGFNQAAMIAHYTARSLELPCVPTALHRVRATSPQSRLSAAARRRNLLRAFVAGDTARARLGSHVALIDDVVTTGSTFASAAQALRAVGVVTVECWAVAAVNRTA
jgi:ComF family protein